MFQTLTEMVDAAGGYADRKAIQLGKEHISYSELAVRVAKIRSGFSHRGITSGHRVGLVLPKSIDTVAAMFATLQLGAAYVPVDPTQPTSRIKAILDDAQCHLVVTTRPLQSSANEPFDGKTMLLDEFAFCQVTQEYQAPVVDRDQLAMILYTSGSTGVPKGVCITHRNLLTFINWAVDEFRLTEDDVFSNHAAFTFDLSTFDIYGALAVGGSLVLLAPEEMGNPRALAEQIESHGITVWYSVPSILQLMVQTGAFADVNHESLRLILFAGEVYPIKQLRLLADRVAHAELYNLYGPTETNVCTFHRVTSGDLEANVPVPIGRPLPGLVTHLVERDEGPEAGHELLIEGPCVTPGYRGDSGSKAAELHRKGIHATGDLVSMRGEDLIYRGRADDMVKINGYRVELGEIETVMNRHPSIEVSAVVALQSGGRVYLQACFEPAAGAPELSLVEMKRHCAEGLPVYMIPHGMKKWPELPRTPNGKIDRRKLRSQSQPGC